MDVPWGWFLKITLRTLSNSAGPHTHIKVVPPICPRLSRPLSTPLVTPYILMFMLNNWHFCFTCSAFARTWKCDSKRGMTPRGAVHCFAFIQMRYSAHPLSWIPLSIVSNQREGFCSKRNAFLLCFYRKLIVHKALCAYKEFHFPHVTWQQVSFPSWVYEGSNNSLHCTVSAPSLKTLRTV